MRVAPGATYEAVLDAGETGLAGTITVGLIDNQGNVVVAFVSTGIIEHPAGTGVYQATGLVAPAASGQYSQVWLVGSATYGVEDVIVSGLAFSEPVAAEAGDFGPCSPWIDGADVSACCAAANAGSDTTILDDVAATAEQILFELSGRRFPGLCERTVRPCSRRGLCGFQILSRGHIVGGWEGTTWAAHPCGCHALSRIELAGFVREVTEVKIDGAVVAAAGYRIDNHRYLTRLADADGDIQLWPSCQRLDLADTETGTMSISYVWGLAPPAVGVSAAAQLACELWKACDPAGGECLIPSNATRITRQGVEIERGTLVGFLTSGATGLVSVDAFLGMYGRNRAPVFWSPDQDPFPQKYG